MNKNKGVSLAEYGIIIALVALSLLPIYFLLGQNIIDYLKNYSNAVTDINTSLDENTDPTKVSILSETVKAGDLNGTPADPVMSCANNICAIDYGSIVLNGIPANFGEIVETTGTAGGTEEIIALLEQVAEQKSEDPKTTEQELIDLQNLIARGKEIVEIEKVYDSFMEDLLSDVNGLVDARNSIDYYNIIKASETSYVNPVDKTIWPVNVGAERNEPMNILMGLKT